MPPGQRDGSLLWYKAITAFLKKNLDLEEHTPYPCVLKVQGQLMRGDDPR